MKLSVFVLAYNHERFIGQALESVLMQRTEFDFEIVVGEDASTDDTAAVIRRLQEAHPDQIRTNLRERNVGMVRNFIETYQSCRGDYVAYLDGDDYWTSPDKLQKQVAYLDERPDYSMCCHNVLVTTEKTGDPPTVLAEPHGRSTIGLNDILIANFVPSCSIVARNRLIDRFPDWLDDMAGCDWVFSLLNTRRGPIGYLNENMAVYRKHPGSCWSSRPPADQLREILRIYDKLPTILGREHLPVIQLATRWANAALEIYRLEGVYARPASCFRVLRRLVRPVVRILRATHLRRLLAKQS